jgi:hypothetical protein
VEVECLVVLGCFEISTKEVFHQYCILKCDKLIIYVLGDNINGASFSVSLWKTIQGTDTSECKYHLFQLFGILCI